jgi:hypothetical protein
VPLMAFLGFDAPLAQSIRGEGGPRTTRIGDCTIHAVVVLTVSNERGTTSSALATQGQSCSARSLEDETLERLVLEVADVLAAQPQLLLIASSEAGPPPKRKHNSTSRRSCPYSPLKRAADLLACKRGRRWYGRYVPLLDARSACASRYTRPLYSPPPHTAPTFLSVACTRARALVRPVRAVLISSSL